MSARPGTPPKQPATQRKRRRSEGPGPRQRTIIGLAVILGLVIITYAIFVKRLPGSERWTVSALVADTSQIAPQSPVRIAGVEVGKVLRIKRGPGTTAELVMEIKSSGRPLHSDATLTISPRLFLEGSYYVDLHPGSPSAPELKEHGTIPLSQTTLPVQFSPVLSTFTQNVRDNLKTIIHNGTASVSDGGALGLNAGLGALGPAFEHSAVVFDAARGKLPDSLTNLIVGAEKVTTALAASAPSLASSITDGNRVAAALAAQDRDLTQTIIGTDQTLIAAPPALRSIQSLLPVLTRVTAEVRPALRAAPAVLRRTAPLLDQVRALTTSSELPRLLTLTQAVSTRTTTLSPKLQELFPRVTAVTKCAQTHGLPSVQAKVDDGKLSTGQPLWQEFAHAYVGGAGINQLFDAYGYLVRAALDFNQNGISLGSVPGVGVLIGNAQQPITGSRPVWNGQTPPALHPEVDCNTQPLDDLTAASGGSGVTRSVSTKISKLPSAAKFESGMVKLVKRMGKASK